MESSYKLVASLNDKCYIVNLLTVSPLRFNVLLIDSSEALKIKICPLYRGELTLTILQ